jgi:hypothetical protein
MARVTQNSAWLQAHATSHTRAQHTNTQALHARTTSHTAPTTAHCAIITACTPPRARHTQHGTQLRPPHTSPTENHTQSHTRPPRHSLQSCQAAQRRRDAAGELVVVQVQLPAGHTNSHRVTPSHPTPPSTPASRPQRIAAQRIASIKSSQMKTSQHTACYRSRTKPCASDTQTTQPDSPQVPDAVIPLDKAATLRRSRTSQRVTPIQYSATQSNIAKQHSNARSLPAHCRSRTSKSKIPADIPQCRSYAHHSTAHPTC